MKIIVTVVVTAIAVLCGGVVWSQTQSVKPSRISEEIKKQREVSGRLPILIEQFKGENLYIKCGYEDENLCYSFILQLDGKDSLRKDLVTILDGGELFLKSYGLRERTCRAENGKILADARKSPHEVVACLQGNAQGSASRTYDDLRKLEKSFREIAAKINFVVGIAEKNDMPEYSSSAFVISHPSKRKNFLVTAGHVAGHMRFVDNKLSVFSKKEPVVISIQFRITEVVDIAVTPANIPGITGGTLEISRNDLTADVTPLAVICNPHVFPLSVRTGFFKEFGDNRGYLEITFPGIGVENGCSGSPVIDLKGKIRGLLIRSVPSGQSASAIPSDTLMRYIDEEFGR